MDNVALVLYVIEVIESITALIIMSSIVIFIGVLIYVFEVTLDSYNEQGLNKKVLACYLSIGSVLLLVGILLPSKKVMYTMAATHYAEEILSNPKMKEVNEKLFKVVNKKLDEYLEDNK